MQSNSEASKRTPGFPLLPSDSLDVNEREEGEFTPDVGDHFPLSCKDPNLPNNAHGLDISLPVAAIKDSRGSNTGNLNSKQKKDFAKTSREFLHPQGSMGFENNRSGPNFATRQQFGPLSNDNLVIKFSNNDSGSDSEDSNGLNNLISSVINPTIAEKPRDPIVKNHITTEADKKISEQKASYIRPYTFSGPNNKLQSLFRSEHSRAAQDRPVVIINDLRKNTVGQEYRNTQSINSNYSKLQDLRHQIALRESELMLKSTQNSKGSLHLDSKRLKVTADGRPRETSVPEKQDIKETANKRQKIRESSNDMVDTGCKMTSTRCIVNEIEPVPEAALHNHEKDNCSCGKLPCPANMPNQNDYRAISGSNKAIGTLTNGGPFTHCDQEGILSRNDGSLLQNRLPTSTYAPSRILTGSPDTSDLKYRNDKNLIPDLHSLVEMEEKCDKELEEAQEQRHKCEIEERNALKAYRKAQRALSKANSRCSLSYSQRDICADYIRRTLLENPNTLWHSEQQKQNSGRVTSTDNAPGINTHSARSDHRDCTINGDAHDNHNLNSEAFSEPQGSTSEILVDIQKMVDNGIGGAVYEDDILSLGHHRSLPICMSGTREAVLEVDVCEDPTHEVPVPNTNDSLLLEACLRSQLYARLGNRVPPKDIEADYHSKLSDQSLKDGEDRAGFSTVSRFESSDNVASGVPLGECALMLLNTMKSSSVSGPIFRSVFQHFKASNVIFSHPIYMVEGHLSKASHHFERFFTVFEVNTCSCNFLIDLFWPFCLFELRGKCNDQDCHWQHSKDYKYGNSQRANEMRSSVDYLSEHCVRPNNIFFFRSFSFHSLLAAPSYLVTFNALTDDSSECSYMHTRVEPCWEKLFSTSLASSRNKKKSSHGNLLNGNLICSELVECMDGSYEMWMVYIKSRKCLDDRIACYDSAISALCCWRDSDDDTVRCSACVLDLFLQMMSCLCMADVLDNDVERMCGLGEVASGKRVYSFSLSDLLKCLTVVSDKCVFWVCCVYVLMYKMLPREIERRLEQPKMEVPVLEWAAVPSSDVKEKVKELMGMAVDAIGCDSVRPVQLFAVNHVRCMMALSGSRNDDDVVRLLLEQYTESHPSSLELSLTSARFMSDGFETALRQWHQKQQLGIVNCIWHQFAEFILGSNCGDKNPAAAAAAAAEVMMRWFQSLRPADDDSNSSLFGLLNMSLLKFLHGDHADAKLALNRALASAAAAASYEDFTLCATEHASLMGDDSSVEAVLETLKEYCMLQPQIGCVPSDFSLLNSIMTAWFGPSLFPPIITSDLKQLVGFVERVLHAFPSNYPLATSLCRLLSAGGLRKDDDAPLFWAASSLLNSLSSAVPPPPEHACVDAVDALRSFPPHLSVLLHGKALSLYPFSILLWRSYLRVATCMGNEDYVRCSAIERGITL